MKLEPQEKLDIALRCYSALSQAAALGAKIGINPQSLRFWIDGMQTALDIAKEEKRKIDVSAERPDNS